MRIAYFDCVGGIAGDMALAGLVSAGASLDIVRVQLASLGVTGWTIEPEEIELGALHALRLVTVAHEEQPLRHLHDITAIIESSGLSGQVKANAIAVFTRLAEAEADAHRQPIETVHFHEVGAIDAIVEIVGTCTALELLGIERIRCSPLPMGRGVVECAHGMLPVPGPAVVHLLTGVPTYGVDVDGETVTPTGAALMVTLANGFGPQPSMRWDAHGCGSGTAMRRIPNVTRVWIGDTHEEDRHDEVVQLETNLDDMNPEWAGFLIERLLDSGALDAFFTPVTMKKSRPGFQLTVLASPEKQAALTEIILAESTTFGVRSSRLRRMCLERRFETVETAYGPIRVKVGLRGDRATTVSPEFEDCRAAALAHSVALKEVYEAALRGYGLD